MAVPRLWPPGRGLRARQAAAVRAAVGPAQPRAARPQLQRLPAPQGPLRRRRSGLGSGSSGPGAPACGAYSARACKRRLARSPGTRRAATLGALRAGGSAGWTRRKIPDRSPGVGTGGWPRHARAARAPASATHGCRPFRTPHTRASAASAGGPCERGRPSLWSAGTAAHIGRTRTSGVSSCACAAATRPSPTRHTRGTAARRLGLAAREPHQRPPLLVLVRGPLRWRAARRALARPGGELRRRLALPPPPARGPVGGGRGAPSSESGRRRPRTGGPRARGRAS
mmetsp:Transcript_2955/g.7964  ORF Transcript_2955/g.7964 Transcript_2955/m.7964 type:complete len:284 (-) Transcript_2955:398-1249(-)